MFFIAVLLLAGEIYALLAHIDKPDILNFTTIGLMVFLCAGLFFLKSLMVNRMVAISETAEAIIRTGDLSRRIPIENSWQDLTSLSAILNKMLSEIERSVVGIRTVSDNIAHDLRTPLTRLRNHIEEMRVGAPHCPTVEAQQEGYANLMAECDGLLATFQALLRISNIESGHRAQAFETLPISAVLGDVLELYEPVAAEKNIRLQSQIASNLKLSGDRDLLFQAFINLLDNAIKYTREGGVIQVELSADAQGKMQFVLRDSGHGIADAEKLLVFRRFYRIEQCRSTPGTGLGLSLVAAIIALHKGTIVLSDNQPHGLVVTITL